MKKKAIRERDREFLRAVQKCLKKKITENKDERRPLLDRANELNMYFNTFSSEQHSCSPPTSSNTDLTPYLFPQLPRHTSTHLPCTSVKDLSKALENLP